MQSKSPCTKKQTRISCDSAAFNVSLALVLIRVQDHASEQRPLRLSGLQPLPLPTPHKAPPPLLNTGHVWNAAHTVNNCCTASTKAYLIKLMAS